MIELPDICMRGKDSCQPIALLQADDDNIDFHCIGLNGGSTREYAQDYLTKCIKTEQGIDMEDDCDKRDLIDEMSITAQALSVLENMEYNDKE